MRSALTLRLDRTSSQASFHSPTGAVGGDQPGVRPSKVGEAIYRLRAAGYDARRRHHPDDPDEPDANDQDGWWDEWDERTERLIGLFDDPDIAPNDPRFYDRGGPVGT